LGANLATSNFPGAAHGQYGEHRLHQHAVLPLAALTEFEIAWIALGGMEAGVVF